MPPFKDENILIIAPGSQTTLAQLGLPESFTPASHRFATRMFAAPDGKSFEPYKVRSRKKVSESNDADTEMAGTAEANEDEEELIELPEDDEDALYPLRGKLLIGISGCLF
jgi:actin-related protein 9